MCSIEGMNDFNFDCKRNLSSPGCTKWSTYHTTTSAASMLSKSGPQLVEPRLLKQDPPSSLKGKDEKSDNGCNEYNQATLQQHLSEELIPSSLNIDNIHYEIKKIVKERTRKIFGETEKLRARVSSLEAENRNLKYKVKILYKAIRAALKCQKETLSARSTSAQTEPHTNRTENGLLGSSLLVEKQHETPIKYGVLESEQRTLCIKERGVATNHDRSIGRDSKTSILSQDDKTVCLSKYVPTMPLTPMQTSFRNGAFLDCYPFSSITTNPLPVFHSSTTRSTNHKRNHVSALNEILQQMFLDSSTPLLEKPPSRLRTSPTIPLVEERGEILSAVSSLTTSPPRKRNSADLKATSPVKELQFDQKRLSDFIFLSAPETTKAEEKTGSFLANTCHVTIANETMATTKTVSLFTNNKTPDCDALAETVITGAKGKAKQKCETFKRETNSTRFLGNSCEATSDAAHMETLLTDSINNSSFVAFVDTPSSNSERKHKLLLPPSSANCFKDAKVFKADYNRRTSLQNSTSLETTAGETGTISTASNNGNTCTKSFSGTKTQSFIAFSASPATFTSELSPTARISGQDHNSQITSRCPSPPGVASPRDQSAGLLTGISMLATAAALGTNTASQTAYPTQSIISSSGSINTVKERSQESMPNEQSSSVNEKVVVENSESLKTAPLISETFISHSQSTCPGEDSSIPASDGERPFSACRENYPSGSSTGSITTKRSSRVAVHQDVPSVVQKRSEKISKDYQHVFSTGRLTSALEQSSFPQLSSAPYCGKYQTIPYRHASHRENQNLLSLATFYKSRKTPKQKPGENLFPCPVNDNPRCHPYPSITANVQDAHLFPVWQNTCKASKKYQRRSPKTHDTSAMASLDSVAQPTQKQCMKFSDMRPIESRCTKDNHAKLSSFIQRPMPVSNQNGFESHPQLTSKSLNLLQTLQSSHHPRFSTTTRSLDTVKKVLNRDSPQGNSPRSNRRGLPVNPQNYGVTKESWIYNCPAISSIPSSVMKSSNDYHSSINHSSKADSRSKPRLEMSKPCQVYLNQLRRKFKEAPQICSPKSPINTEHMSLKNLEPQSKRQKVDGNSDCEQEVPVVNSGKGQVDICSEQQLFDPFAPPAEGEKEKNYHWQYKKPSNLIFHHKKFTSPPHRQQQYLLESWLRSTECENSSETMQTSQEFNGLRN